jgi:pimeloyl-ACP methyl ester carboxylesterase
MNAQTRDVLDAYAAEGGTYTEEVFADVGHSPHIERPEQFRSLVLDFMRN